MDVLARGLSHVKGAASVEIVIQLYVVDVLEAEPEVWHEDLYEVRLVNHVANVAVPLLRVVCVPAVEVPEHFVWHLLLQIHVYDQDDDARVEEITQEEHFNNGAHFL